MNKNNLGNIKTFTLIILGIILVVGLGVGIRYYQEKNNKNSKLQIKESITKESIVSTWVCGNIITDVRDNKIYNTVLIGSQCWFAQNLNIGTMIPGDNNQGNNCSTIKKYCYYDSEDNCTSDGAFYQWNQAMCGSHIAGTQGICPVSWHIPTHDEFTVLERAVCISETCAADFPYDASTGGERGTNEGVILKSGGSSGFNVSVAGFYSSPESSFTNDFLYTMIWSSVESGSNAWVRIFDFSLATVQRGVGDKLNGLSVRCLRD